MAEDSGNSIGDESLPAADLPPPPMNGSDSESVAAESVSDQTRPGWFKRNLVAIAVGVVALVVGVGIGGLAFGSSSDSGSKGTASSKTTVTTQRQAASTTTTIARVPIPSDFKIDIIQTENQCFGSAGCVVRYQISPTYVGPGSLSPSKTYTVVYQVLGGDSPKTANFRITGSQVEFREETVGAPRGSTLTAVVTSVLPG